MKKKRKEKSFKLSTNKKILEEIIRVNHAGEYGATRIYDGQIAVFGKNSKVGKTIKQMADQEQEHIETFRRLIIQNRIRPTAMQPLWNVAGFYLGVVTALMGKKAAMACTVAVEKIISEHYGSQISLLQNDQKKLISIIKKFQKDEIEHHNIGVAHQAEKAPAYNLLSGIISFGCKTAIALSKKI